MHLEHCPYPFRVMQRMRINVRQSATHPCRLRTTKIHARSLQWQTYVRTVHIQSRNQSRQQFWLQYCTSKNQEPTLAHRDDLRNRCRRQPSYPHRLLRDKPETKFWTFWWSPFDVIVPTRTNSMKLPTHDISTDFVNEYQRRITTRCYCDWGVEHWFTESFPWSLATWRIGHSIKFAITCTYIKNHDWSWCWCRDDCFSSTQPSNPLKVGPQAISRVAIIKSAPATVVTTWMTPDLGETADGALVSAP